MHWKECVGSALQSRGVDWPPILPPLSPFPLPPFQLSPSFPSLLLPFLPFSFRSQLPHPTISFSIRVSPLLPYHCPLSQHWKGYVHSTIRIQVFRRGFFRVRQKSTLGALSSFGCLRCCARFLDMAAACSAVAATDDMAPCCLAWWAAVNALSQAELSFTSDSFTFADDGPRPPACKSWVVNAIAWV